MASVIAFLAGDDAEFVTGEAVVVHGGLTAAGPSLSGRIGMDAMWALRGVSRGSTGEPTTFLLIAAEAVDHQPRRCVKTMAGPYGPGHRAPSPWDDQRVSSWSCCWKACCSDEGAMPALCIIISLLMSPSTLIWPDMKACIAACGLPSMNRALATS